MSDQEVLVTLESIISLYLKPTFLAITLVDGDVQIVISMLEFRNMSVQERVNYVFKLLSSRCSAIIRERLVLVQTFSGDEMESVIEHVFEEDNEIT